MKAEEARKIAERAKLLSNNVLLEGILKSAERGHRYLFWYRAIEEDQVKYLESLGYRIEKPEGRTTIIRW